jgi:hypothetical protein
LLSVFWVILIFGGFMGRLRLCEQAMRRNVRRDDHSGIIGTFFSNERRQMPFGLDEFFMRAAPEFGRNYRAFPASRPVIGMPLGSAKTETRAIHCVFPQT